MVTQIRISALKNKEFIQFFTDVLAIIQQTGPIVLSVQTQYQQLETVLAEADALLHNRRTHKLSTQLEALDARRESAMNGLLRLIEGYLYSTDVQQKTFAETLQNHINGFGGNPARDNYQGQTTMVRRLLSDFSNQPDLHQSIAGLGLSAWLTELSSANLAFSAQYLARAQDTSLGSPESVSRKRNDVIAAWNKLRTRLNSHYDIEDGIEPWAGTINFINSLSGYYTNLLIKRGNKHAARETPAEMLPD